MSVRRRRCCVLDLNGRWQAADADIWAMPGRCIDGRWSLDENVANHLIGVFGAPRFCIFGNL